MHDVARPGVVAERQSGLGNKGVGGCELGAREDSLLRADETVQRRLPLRLAGGVLDRWWAVPRETSADLPTADP